MQNLVPYLPGVDINYMQHTNIDRAMIIFSTRDFKYIEMPMIIAKKIPTLAHQVTFFTHFGHRRHPTNIPISYYSLRKLIQWAWSHRNENWYRMYKTLPNEKYEQRCDRLWTIYKNDKDMLKSMRNKEIVKLKFAADFLNIKALADLCLRGGFCFFPTRMSIMYASRGQYEDEDSDEHDDIDHEVCDEEELLSNVSIDEEEDANDIHENSVVGEYDEDDDDIDNGEYEDAFEDYTEDDFADEDFEDTRTTNNDSSNPNNSLPSGHNGNGGNDNVNENDKDDENNSEENANELSNENVRDNGNENRNGEVGHGI